jgi:hypothetical protein
MRKIVIVAIVLVASCSDPQSNSLIESFFEQYETKGSNEAIDFLFSSNKWIEPSASEILDLKQSLSSTIKLLGNYNGYEKISVINVGKDLMHYTYLVKYEQQPLRFTFTLYRPTSKWQIQNFTFDYHLLNELNEASKLNNLKPH